MTALTYQSSPTDVGFSIQYQKLKEIFPDCRVPQRILLFVGPLNMAARKFKINTPLRWAHWLAQLGHESGSLNYLQEIWGPTPAQSNYEGRTDLGNSQLGDGFRFRGRGLIQLTGRANYRKFSQYLGVDFEADPDLLLQPEYSSLAAGWYWYSRGLNSFADNDDLLTITRRVNGGTNGYHDRQSYLNCAKSVLGLTRTKADRIKEIQSALNRHGYHLAVDGIHGPRTDQAIRNFQWTHRLAVDGIVGPITAAALGI